MLDVDRTPGIRPAQNLWRRVDAMARSGFPFVCTLALMLAANAPLGIPEQAVLLPAVTVISVFFWSVYRPASLPPPVVCLIGVFLDLLGWLPLGVGPVTLLVVQGLSLRWRRGLARQSFAVIWIVLASFGTGAAMLIWAAVCALNLQMFPADTAFFQAVITIALYPVIAIPLTQAHRSIADPDLA